LDRRDAPFGEVGKFDGRQSHKYRDSIGEVCSCLSVGIRLVCLRFCPRCAWDANKRAGASVIVCRFGLSITLGRDPLWHR